MKIFRFALSVLCAIIALSTPQQSFAQKIGVTASADPRATQAGMEMLRKGGTAADAAMAMMLTLTVVEPQSSGIGGGGFLLYQNGKTGILSTMNGRETAPQSATPDRFLDAAGNPLPFMDAFPGGRSVGVPGNIALMAKTHKKWGKLPWATLFAPAIRLADKGFVVSAILETRLKSVEKLWEKFPHAQKIYWVDGKPAPKGTLIRNPDLAKTLRVLAKAGPKAFYTGAIAKSLVETVQQSPVAPSDMSLADMAKYKAKEQSALCAPYRVYVVCGMAPPSSGATTILQMLGILEHFDMKALGKDNPKSWHLLGEAMQLAYADRDAYLGDPDFVDVPVAGLIDPLYLSIRAAQIDPDHAASSYSAGMPPSATKRTAAVSGEISGTTHFVARDKFGSVATMTSTIEGLFGSQLISGGYFLNNELTDFTFAPEKNGAPVANRVQGGKRPLSSMSPTIVYDAKGRMILALGSAGGKRIIMHVAKTLIGVLDYGLPLDQAIAMPNIFFAGGKLLIEKGAGFDALSGPLSAYGQFVEPLDFPSKVTGVQHTDNGWTGAADPRSEGTALVE